MFVIKMLAVENGQFQLKTGVLVVTCWWSWWSTRGGEDENDTPTSHRDLLVVLVIVEGQRE